MKYTGFREFPTVLGVKIKGGSRPFDYFSR